LTIDVKDFLKYKRARGLTDWFASRQTPRRMGDYGTPLFLFFFFFFSLLSHPQVFASSSTEGRSSVEHVPMTTTSVGLMRCQRQDPLCQLSMMHVIHSMMFSSSVYRYRVCRFWSSFNSSVNSQLSLAPNKICLDQKMLENDVPLGPPNVKRTVSAN
jgi:hypothetical protein